MEKVGSFALINDDRLYDICGGNGTINWIIADMLDAYGNMVTYQHMKPSPINN